MRRFGAVLIGGVLAGQAHAAALSGVDFVVDAQKHQGQTVEVRSYYIDGGGAFLLDCAVYNDRGVLAGRIFFDRATMDRESLRTGLERCIGNRTRIRFAWCPPAARSGSS
jgi:hypothetical protein